MKLPNRQRSIVPKAKLVDYLLSFIHPVGKDKAEFFTRFGFVAERWELMEQALRLHAEQHDVARVDQSSPLGTHYIIEGQLETPDGRNPFVRVVWFIEFGSEVPHLVTAYPLKTQK